MSRTTLESPEIHRFGDVLSGADWQRTDNTVTFNLVLIN